LARNATLEDSAFSDLQSLLVYAVTVRRPFLIGNALMLSKLNFLNQRIDQLSEKFDRLSEI
jgi:hypothetical protein